MSFLESALAYVASYILLGGLLLCTAAFVAAWIYTGTPTWWWDDYFFGADSARRGEARGVSRPPRRTNFPEEEIPARDVRSFVRGYERERKRQERQGRIYDDAPVNRKSGNS